MSNQSTQSMLNRAQALLSEKRLPEAREIYQQICKRDKNNDTVWMMLGNLNGALGNIAGAEECCRKAIQLNPTLVNAHANLGNALMSQNNYADAAVSFTKATELQADLAPAWFMLGKAQQKLGCWSEAEAAFRRALKLNANWQEARLLLGNSLQFMGRFQDAIQEYETLIQNQGDHAEAYYRLAISLSSMGNTAQAEKNCREALKIQAEFVPALNSLSMILTSQGKTDEALKCCKRALEIQPDDINAACMAANIYEQSGKAKIAYNYLKPHINAGKQHQNLALAFAAISKELGFQDDAITMMEDLLAHAQGLTNTGRRNLCFTLGKLCDNSQQYDRAFKHYQQGNELRPALFNIQKHSQGIDTSIRIQTADFFDDAADSANKSNRPIFIVGMPRSGTSLVEQILASHSDVFGAGELAKISQLAHSLSALSNTNKPYPEILESVNKKILQQCADQYLQHLNDINTDALRVVDKMPGNFFYLGLIQLLFPNARVIHCKRQPLDNCLSCYFQDFFQSMDWCYEQKNLAVYYHAYKKLMTHWKQTLKIPIMDVSYEELVADQENISRKLMGFCDLDWSDDCLEFHKAKRFVATASYDQVRQPMYKKSVARWKNYEAHIEPLKNALGIL